MLRAELPNSRYEEIILHFDLDVAAYVSGNILLFTTGTSREKGVGMDVREC